MLALADQSAPIPSLTPPTPPSAAFLPVVEVRLALLLLLPFEPAGAPVPSVFSLLSTHFSESVLLSEPALLVQPAARRGGAFSRCRLCGIRCRRTGAASMLAPACRPPPMPSPTPAASLTAAILPSVAGVKLTLALPVQLESEPGSVPSV